MAQGPGRGSGVVLGTFAGDVLGAPLEGESQAVIMSECPDGPWTVVDGRQFANAVASRAAVGMAMPPSSVGEYTDDTEATLALAESLLTCRGLDPRHAAVNSAFWWVRGNRGGYSADTFAKLRRIADAEDFALVGAPTPNTPGGSYGNGGAMKIAPLGYYYRSLLAELPAPQRDDANANANDADAIAALSELVAGALVSTHTHPEAIDGATVLAAAVAQAANLPDGAAAAVDGGAWLEFLASAATTEPLRSNLASVAAAVVAAGPGAPVPDSVYVPADKELLQSWTDKWFQIRTSDAVPAVLYMVCRYGVGPHADPAAALVRAVSLGGDCDTIGAMVGALLGALHGPEWIPSAWTDVWENSPPFGYDAAVAIGRDLDAAPPPLDPVDHDAASAAADDLLAAMATMPKPIRHI